MNAETHQQSPRKHADPLVGRTIAGRYRLDALLGQGGSGKLYRAAQSPFERAVALRVLPPAQKTPQALERFAREAAVAAKLAHPNSVRLVDFGRLEDGTPFLVMEHLTGTSLADLVRQGPLDQVRALHVAQQICRSLREAHSLNILHRGLRSSSVMLLREHDDADFVKVMDFGLPPADAQGQLALLPAPLAYYLAPEQARAQLPDARTDVYALGALMYEMLTGRVPFAGTTATEVIVRHLAEAPMPLRQRRPDLDEALERVVLRCLHKDKAARFQSMDELLEQLKVVRARLTRTRVEQTLPPTPAHELLMAPVAPLRPTSDSVRPVAPAAPRAPAPAPEFARMISEPRSRWRIAAGVAAVAVAGALIAAALHESPDRAAASTSAAVKR
jgi:serine/threonine-protein kinase